MSLPATSCEASVQLPCSLGRGRKKGTKWPTQTTVQLPCSLGRGRKNIICGPMAHSVQLPCSLGRGRKLVSMISPSRTVQLPCSLGRGRKVIHACIRFCTVQLPCSLGRGRKSQTANISSLQAQSSTMTLKNPGNFIFLNDHQIRHGVTPVAHLNPVREGSRDTLIVMFTKI